MEEKEGAFLQGVHGSEGTGKGLRTGKLGNLNQGAGQVWTWFLPLPSVLLSKSFSFFFPQIFSELLLHASFFKTVSKNPIHHEICCALFVPEEQLH